MAETINNKKYEVITKYIKEIEYAESFGNWTNPSGKDGTPENPQFFPYVDYAQFVQAFEVEFYRFRRDLPYNLGKYQEILEKHDMPEEWSSGQLLELDVSSFDEQSIMALIYGVLRADRFSEGTLLEFFESGCILKWLKRLREIDELQSTERIGGEKIDKSGGCEHKNLYYAGKDTDENGHKCSIMICKDCDEEFMQGRPHP